jgi:nucleotide-binding universal stress UspA family protein
MLRFDTILFPVDFSDRCRGAARYVEAVAGRFQSRLVLLHVLETTIGQPGDLDFGGLATSLQWEDRTARAQQLLDDFGAPEVAHLNVARRLESGDPARTIIRVAREENAGLIAMPTHGYGGFRRFILGSVTAKVLHDAACPVWTGVHMENAPTLEAISIRSIVCALDLSARSPEVLAASAWLANEYGARLTLVHAVPGTEAIPERILDCELRRHLIAQARERLQTLAAEAGAETGVAVESGEAARVVDTVVRRESADLVVIGRGQHSGFGRLRTHAYAIIRESPCPVLSI